MARFEEPRGEPRKLVTGGSEKSALNLAATPVIALHGFTGRGADWALTRDRLKGHAWLTPDLPGHGPSPALPADLPAHLSTVERALGFFSERPVLLGYSMGARIALHAALAMPESFSALVLIGGSPGLESEAERLARHDSDEALAGRLLKTDVATFIANWDAQPLIATRDAMPEPWKSRSLEARRQNTAAGLVASLEGVGTGALPSLWSRLGDIRIPTLILTGERDPKFSAIAEKMAAAIPGATAATIPGAGHAAHQEATDALVAVLADWLAAQSQPE